MKCEIEFLPVGQGSKPGDAIVVRYGEPNSYELVVVDGGTVDSGKAIVEHIRSEFGQQASVSHLVLTHPDGDHACGLREVLSGLPVRNLWLNPPWEFAGAALPYFANKNWTDRSIAQAIYKEYDIIAEIVAIAQKWSVPITAPLTGRSIGPFRVLWPSQRVYPLMLAQFDRTPAPDELALMQAGWWIGKQPGAFAKLAEKLIAKAQKLTRETWENERLKDGGITSATNESSVILYGDFGQGRRVLLTGDAGIVALTEAANYADQNGLALRDFMFVQIPHHGSRRNVGPTILDRLVGPIQPSGAAPRFHAYVSAPPDDDTHPRKMVVNAFIRRGALVAATQGGKKVFWGGFPPRPGYGPLTPLSFAESVEDYD